MGSPWPLSREQIRILRENDGPALDASPQLLDGKECVDLEYVLPMHGVCLVLLVKRISRQETIEKLELSPETGAWGGKQVFLRWKYSVRPDLAGYKVFRKKADEAGYRSINKPENTLCSYFIDLDVEPGASYCYSVAAVYADGTESSPSSEVPLAIPAEEGYSN
jgi:hypothetical protein